MSTLRFGTAARSIKNRPKINKEFTVEELKQIISKKDRLITSLRKRVCGLEIFIKQSDFEVPSEEACLNLVNNSDSELNPNTELQECSKENKQEFIQEDSDEYLDSESSSQDVIEDTDESEQHESWIFDIPDEEQKEKARQFLQLVHSNSIDAKDKEQKICTEFLKTLRGLTHEKARCRAQVDFIANLQEDLQIVSSKLPKFSELEEEYIEYKEQANQKINILKEDAEKTKNELEIKNAQFIKTERELTEFKKLYIATKAQLERGDCKNSQFIASEISQNNDYIKEAIEGFEFLKKAIKDLQNKTEENDRLLSRELEQQESSSEIQDFLKETDNWVNN